MERSILSVKRTDRIRNTTLRSKTGIIDVGNKAARLKWNWAGHVSRMHPDRWANVTTQWVPEGGRRRRGRPRKRWKDDLEAYQSGLVRGGEGKRHMEELGGGVCPAVGQYGLIKNKVTNGKE